MVRVGGMDYACAPGAKAGHRISDMVLDNGRAIEATKSYRVAGWASVNEQRGKPVSEVLASDLRRNKTATIARLNQVKLKGVARNPGIARSR
jgi:sulfur-oxidizing protein SoxB